MGPPHSSGQRERRGAQRWRALIAPVAGITDLAERRVSQLVAVVALVLSVLTWIALLLGLVLEPALFYARLAVMLLLQASYALIYLLNRSRHYRVAAFLICAGPVWSNLLVGLETPRDPIWFAFLPVSVVLASVLLSFRASALVAGLAVAAAGLVVALRHAALSDGRGLLILCFVVICNAIVLAIARFRTWVEDGRRAELQELERRLADTQRMEALGRLAAGVAHDFNNFLLVIQGSVELARRERPSRQLDDIDVAAHRAASLIAQLLAFARQRPRSPAALRINDVVRDLERILARLIGSQVELALRLDARWPVEADRVQIEQILINLVANARDALPNGGHIQISTRDEQLPELDARGVPAGEYVVLSIEDDGVGMDAATLQRAFEPFFSTKAPSKGSGLGLATVQSAVAQSGGQVLTESEPGRGTKFAIWLPRCPRDPEAGATALIASAVALSNPEHER
jgi:signal transduction histidine kinase